jgi:hypothetical protein
VEFVLPDAYRSVSVVHAEVPIAANGIGQATLDYVSYVPELLDDNECSLEVTGFEDGLFTVFDLDYTANDDGSYTDVRLVYEFSDITESAVLTCPVIGSIPYTVNGHDGLYYLLHLDERDHGAPGVLVVDWEAGSGSTLGTKRYERSMPHPTGGTTTEVTTLVLTLADAGGHGRP